MENLHHAWEAITHGAVAGTLETGFEYFISASVTFMLHSWLFVAREGAAVAKDVAEGVASNVVAEGVDALKEV